MFISALLHLVRGQRQDLHDDVQAVAERPVGQGEQIYSFTFRQVFQMFSLSF